MNIFLPETVYTWLISFPAFKEKDAKGSFVALLFFRFTIYFKLSIYVFTWPLVTITFHLDVYTQKEKNSPLREQMLFLKSLSPLRREARTKMSMMLYLKCIRSSS